MKYSIQLLTASMLLGATVANACVEAETSNFGTLIKNSCPYMVNISYCFGADCIPPEGVLAKLARGFEKKVSDRGQQIRYVYCKVPLVPRSGRCE